MHQKTQKTKNKSVLLGVPAEPWDERSRDSKMSRATTTRTVASIGFSSLASSAFQMPDNVFGDRGRQTLPANLASDTISLEALSPRPRSRSRSRGLQSKASGHRDVISGRRSSR